MKKPPWGRLSIVPANVTLWIPYPVRPVWAVVREIHQVFVSFKRPQNNTVWPGVLIYVRVIIVLAHNPPRCRLLRFLQHLPYPRPCPSPSVLVRLCRRQR